MRLAMRAVAMTAGMWNILFMITLSTTGQHTWTYLGTADLHGAKRIALRGKNLSGILGQKLWFKLFNDG